MLTTGALWFALLRLHWLPKSVGPAVTALGAVLLLGSAVLACASAVVLAGYKRDALGKPDLFLELNRSREPAAIEAAPAARTTRTRRWLAQRLSRHDLVVGDLVEVKPWTEIRATLDDSGCLEELPILPEMLAMCGQRARVFRCAHRLFDYRKSRRMRHMDGAVLLVGGLRRFESRRLSGHLSRFGSRPGSDESTRVKIRRARRHRPVVQVQ
jgi:hypothetical protein